VGWHTKRKKGLLLSQLEMGVQTQGAQWFKGHQLAGFQQCFTPQMVMEII